MKKTKIKSLVAIAYSDGFFDVSELKLLNEKAISLGITNEEVIAILQNPYQDEFIPPVTFKEQIEFLFDLMQMIYADGQLEKNEKKLFLKYLDNFNFEENEYDDVFIIHGLLA